MAVNIIEWFVRDGDTMYKSSLGTKIEVVLIIPLLIITNGYFLFTVMADPSDDFSLKWNCVLGMSAIIGPVTKDIDGDGVHEIFIAGRRDGTTTGRIVSICGLDGSIIWAVNFTSGSTDCHAPCAIADLDNDGDYEIVHVADDRTIARNCEDGTEFWNVATPSGWHQFVIADTDGTGYPYVYVSDHDDVYPYDAKVSKLYGTNGSVAAQADHYYSCYGGVSAADLNGDGNVEILVSDRSSGKGMRCYDEDLNLLWYEDDITCSSHCLMPVNVTGDSDLEVVALRQGSYASENGGIYVLGSDGNKIPGKCSTDLDLGCHVHPAVYDIDKDGHLELATAFGTSCKVWDLTDWSLDFETPYNHISVPPNFANVIGDSDLEMIVCDAWNGAIRIYDSAYVLQESLACNALSTMTQDIDNDGKNEMMVLFSGTIKVYDTLADAPTPAVRTDTPYYSERRTGAAEYIALIGNGETNTAPVVSDIPNQTVDEGTSFATISLDDYVTDAEDPDSAISWSYSGNSELTVDITNRVATITTPNENWNGEETITFTATDTGGLDDSDDATFNVTASNDPPNTPSNPTPANGATGVSINIDLSWTGGDLDGDPVTYNVYFGTTSPPPQVVNNQSGTTYDPGTLNYKTTYYWKIVAWDDSEASTSGSIWEFETIEDTISPDITNVASTTSNPPDTNSLFGWINITCDVTDNVAVNKVYLNITNPDGSYTNVSMNAGALNSYYYNSSTAFSTYGNYSYVIWANDTNDNEVSSSNNDLSMSPNWDINNDGTCNVFDYVLVSNHYGETGTPGWIREDVDNNGEIQVMDLVLVSGHYGESWWA